jgi:hypothetical protein
MSFEIAARAGKHDDAGTHLTLVGESVPPGPAVRSDRAAGADEHWLGHVSRLARDLADAMLAQVQNTAALNFDAATRLLAYARLPPPHGADRSDEAWRMAWRSFEICATSCEQMLGVARAHGARTHAEVWRAAARTIDALAQADAGRVQAVREAFDTLAQLQTLCWQAARDAHREVVALVHAAQTETDDGRH